MGVVLGGVGATLEAWQGGEIKYIERSEDSTEARLPSLKLFATVANPANGSL